MEKLRLLIFLLITVVLAATWGYFQSILFPLKEYGYLFLFTSIFGGYIIGYLGSKIYIYIEDKFF